MSTCRGPTVAKIWHDRCTLPGEHVGMQFLEVLRSYYRGQFMPVILLTALKDGPHVHRASHFGVKRIFLKSDYDLADLLACVNELSAPVRGQDSSVISTRPSLGT